MFDHYWFRPKCYGYGFGLPLCWQGWIALAVLLGLLVLAAYIDGILPLPADGVLALRDGLRFLLDVTLIIGIFTALLRDKVEGKLKWQ